MFEQLVYNTVKEGTTIFTENDDVFLIIDTCFDSFEMYTKETGRALLEEYVISKEDFIDEYLIGESKGIKVYFFEA